MGFTPKMPPRKSIRNRNEAASVCHASNTARHCVAANHRLAYASRLLEVSILLTLHQSDTYILIHIYPHSRTVQKLIASLESE